MGGKSSKQTIGYWYQMDVLATFAMEVDEVTEAQFGERTGWAGSMTESGTISIYEDELFGGEKREGGVYGQVDFMFGEPTMPINEYLGSSMRKSGITGPVPAYRNTFSMFFRGVDSISPEFTASGVWVKEAEPAPLSTVPSFILKTKPAPRAFRWSALNPYFKPFKIKASRYTKDWHPEIAKIAQDAEVTNYPNDTTWDYCQFPFSTPVGTVAPETRSPPPVGGGGYTWFNGQAPIGWTNTGAGINSLLPGHGDKASWIIKTINVPAYANRVTFSGYAENSGYLYIDGRYVYSNNPTNYQPSVNLPFQYSTALSPGQHTIAVFLTNELGSNSSSSDQIQFNTTITFSSGADMNPAHIIRECLTNTEWGMGYPTADLDDARFYAVAQTLYDEGFGISLKWAQQSTIEDFIMLVLKHINGVVTQDRSTGKLFIKLIRNDYTLGSLLTLDQTNSDLVSYSRATGDEIVNEVTVKYTTTDGRSDSVTVHDLASLTVGQPVSQDIDLPGIRNPKLAARVAQRELESRIKPLAKLTITTDRRAFNLYEGDVFKFSWIDHGISDMVCRAISIDLGTLDDNKITIQAVQDVFGFPATSYVKPTYSDWIDPIAALSPSPYRYITETPYYDIARTISTADLNYLEATDCYIDVYAQEPSPDALGYNLWTAAGTADLQNRAVASYAGITTLTAALVREETSVLQVQDASDIANLIETENACVIINGEYMHITDYDTDANTIDVNRGVLDTVPAEHAIGDKVILADASAGQDEISYIPTEVVKVKAQTHSSRGDLLIGSTPEDTYTINQRQARPYPPGQVRVNGVAYPDTISLGSGLSLTWKHRNRLTQTASIIDQATGTITPEASTEYTLRIYGDSNTLLRTVNGLTGESYDYTTTLEATDGGGTIIDSTPRIDTWWDKTKLLLNFNGANASTTFVDSSPNFANVVGNAQISTARYKNGNASLLLNGTSDYITLSDSDNFAFGSGDFTIEAWVYGVFNTGGYVPIYGQMASTGSDNNRQTFYYSASTDSIPNAWCFYDYTTTSNVLVGVADTPPTNTWFHLAISKQGSSYRVFRNGTQIGTTQTSAATLQNVAGNLYVGTMRLTGVLKYLNGNIDDLRVTKGVARYTSTFTPPTGEIGKFYKGANFSDNKLLLVFDGTNGATTTSDVSDLALPIALTGAAQISTTQSKFGGSSLYLDGTASTFGTVGFHSSQIGTSDITAECFIYMPDATLGGVIMSRDDGLPALGWMLAVSSTSRRVYARGWDGLGGYAFQITSAINTVASNTWHHVALVRNGTTWTIYVDGVSVGSTTESASVGAGGSDLLIGKTAVNDYPLFAGYIDEVRIRALAAYTTTFSPPTSSNYTPDANWASTVLLMNFNGSNGSTEMENIAEYTKTLTAVGNAQISTAQSKFGGASGYFDGTGDYLTYPNNSDYSANSGDFCVEAWIRPATLASIRVIASKRPAGGATATEWEFYTSASGQIAMVAWNSSGTAIANVVGTTVLTVNTWYHVAMCRQGSTWRLFVDGVLDGSGAQSGTVGTNNALLYIGYDASTAGAGRDWNGYIDDLRITRGARYTKTFTPPASELAKLVAGIDPYWDKVSVLLNCNGANASTTFTDSSSNNLAVTAVGNAQISTAQSKFGGASGYFDGTGDYLTMEGDTFPGDFTVECWIYPLAIPASNRVFFQMGNEASGRINFYINNGIVRYDIYSVGTTDLGGSTIVANSWQHLAIVRVDTTITAYVNGISVGTATLSGTLGNSSIRSIGANNTGGSAFNGYIDDFRVTKSYARYTANFTPPTMELGEVLYTATSLNTQLRFELESKRDGLTSWKMHNHTVVRA